MCKRQGLSQWNEDVQRHLDSHFSMFFQILVQCRSINELHNKKRLRFIDQAKIEGSDQVRVIEPTSSLSLLLQPHDGQLCHGHRVERLQCKLLSNVHVPNTIHAATTA